MATDMLRSGQVLVQETLPKQPVEHHTFMASWVVGYVK